MKKRTVSLCAPLACLGLLASACGDDSGVADPMNMAGSAAGALAGAPSAGSGGAGAGQAGSGEAGSGQAGSGEAGSGQAGSGEAGSGQAGSGEAGSGEAGSGQAGSGEAGSGQAGSGEAGAAGMGLAGAAGAEDGGAGGEAGASGVEAMTFADVRAFLETPIASHSACFDCHLPGRDAPPVFQDDDTLYDTLLSKKIADCEERALVVPGDPSSSALYLVLLGECGEANRMPAGCFQDQFENNCAPPEAIEALGMWIADGAQP